MTATFTRLTVTRIEGDSVRAGAEIVQMSTKRTPSTAQRRSLPSGKHLVKADTSVIQSGARKFQLLNPLIEVDALRIFPGCAGHEM